MKDLNKQINQIKEKLSVKIDSNTHKNKNSSKEGPISRPTEIMDLKRDLTDDL